MAPLSLCSVRCLCLKIPRPDKTGLEGGSGFGFSQVFRARFLGGEVGWAVLGQKEPFLGSSRDAEEQGEAAL